jgi:hypothetical protein
VSIPRGQKNQIAPYLRAWTTQWAKTILIAGDGQALLIKRQARGCAGGGAGANADRLRVRLAEAMALPRPMETTPARTVTAATVL